MSKIALSPSASGTGTFTIASPNSNSDRTLNLPDGSGALYNQSNILGTVSQSGGVPTGAIIERGSNANGEYVRYADGTQIATKRVDFSGITLNPAAAGFGNSALGASLSMAASFVSARYTLGRIQLRDSGGNDVYGGTYTYDGGLWIFHSGIRPADSWPQWAATGSTVVTQGFYEVIAIGRWF